MSENAPYVSLDLLWGVGFTRSQNISQATTTIKLDTVNLCPVAPEAFLEIFLRGSLLFPEEKFQEKPLATGSQSDNHIFFPLFIQKGAKI